MVNITEILQTIGDGYKGIIAKILSLIPPELLSNPTTISIVSLIIPLLLILIVIKVIESAKPAIKWAIVILSIILIVSVIATFIS